MSHFSEASINKVGEGRLFPTTIHSKTSSPHVARTLSSIDLVCPMISVFEQHALNRADLLSIAFVGALVFDPIVFSTARKVLSGFYFDEEVASMEVTVRVS